MDSGKGNSPAKSSLGKSLRKGGMMGTVAALAMSGLAGSANLIKSAGNVLRGKGRPNIGNASVQGISTMKHSRAYDHSGGNPRGKSKHRVKFHPMNAGLPFDAEFGYLNSKLNGRALERYFEAVENLHGPDKAAKERAQAGFAA